MFFEAPRLQLLVGLATALLLVACGSSGDSGRGAEGLIDNNPGGGTGTITDQLRLTITTEDQLGDPITSGGLAMRPGERRRFTALLEDIRTPSRPRAVPDVTINFAVEQDGAASSDAFITFPTVSGACPSPGQFSERRGGVTDANGEVAFCLIAPPSSRFTTGQNEIALNIAGVAFSEAGRPPRQVRTEGLFDLVVIRFQDNYFLELLGPGGQVSESLTLDAGTTLNGFTAQLSSEIGDPIPNGTFIRLTNDQSLGEVITPQASGGTVGANGRLNFGYRAGCPSVAASERVSLLGSSTVNGVATEATYDLFVRRPAATVNLQVPQQTAPVFSGDRVQNVELRVARADRASLAGVPVTLAARLNGNVVGNWIDPNTGVRDNPLVVTLPASGLEVLDFETPVGLVNNQRLDLTALLDDTENSCLRASATPRTLVVNTAGQPTLEFRGGSGESLDAVEIREGTTQGFTVLAADGQGRPLTNQNITLSRAPTTGVGRLIVPGVSGSTAITNFEGLISFSYEAPTTVAQATPVTVSAAATLDGRSVTQTLNLLLTPPPPPPPPVITLLGPGTASPGVETRGYRATVTRSNGAAIQGAQVTFSASNGTLSVIENGVLRPNQTVGRTDAQGRVEFAFTPSATITEDVTAAITARLTNSAAQPVADNLIGAQVETACLEDVTAICDRTLSVTVQADDFRFISPIFGTSVTVGGPNAQALSLRWVTAQGQPVANPQGGAPCVDLSTTFTGSGQSVFGLIISGDPTPQTQRRRVQLGANGNFAQTVEVFSDRSGFLEIQARENRNCGATTTGSLLATTGVQFIDEPCEQSADGRDCVDLRLPLVLTVDPDSNTQPSVELVMEVRNNAFQPIDGSQVLFRIINAASGGGMQPINPNERIFPGGGTTDANGVARSTYFAPLVDVETTVRLEGCVRAAGSGDIDGRFCRQRELILRPTL